jgi:hypothetical protein
MRALALVATGLWIGLLAASWMIATLSFRTSAALASPAARGELRERLASLSEDDRRAVFRHAAAELNRAMFSRWLIVQIGLGLLLLALAVVREPAALVLAAIALALVLGQAALQGPIREVGRSVDFLPRPLPAEVGARFGRLHAAYVLVDVGKLAVLIGLAWRLASATR